MSDPVRPELEQRVATLERQVAALTKALAEQARALGEQSRITVGLRRLGGQPHRLQSVSHDSDPASPLELLEREHHD